MSLKDLIRRSEIDPVLKHLRRAGKRIVFTNGVFDILHRGHVEYLAKAKSFGDVLIVGLNTDASVRRIKGRHRPIQTQQDRAVILLALEAVDYVVLFGEDIPEKIIRAIKPDVLVKGADWKMSSIVGADYVRSYGGKVKRVKLSRGRSTSDLLKKIHQV